MRPVYMVCVESSAAPAPSPMRAGRLVAAVPAQAGRTRSRTERSVAG